MVDMSGHDYGKAIKRAREDAGLTQDELAEKMGKSKKTIWRLEANQRPINTNILESVASATGRSVEELMGRGGKIDASSVTMIRQKLIAIPLYSKASEVCAGGGNVLPQPEIEMPFYVLEDWVGGPLAPKQVYAIRMEGDSMEPKIPGASIVVVNPNVEVRSGDVAVVCIDDRMMVKQVFFRGNGVELNPLNPAYKAATFTQEELDGLHLPYKGRLLTGSKEARSTGLIK
jgi:repressor LexA